VKLFFNYLLIFVAFLLGCTEDKFTPADDGFNYFPLQTGDFRIYAIEETTYAEGATPQNNFYQLMTEVVDSFPTGDQHFTYVINRFQRELENSPWRIVDTWSVKISDNELIVNEGNIAYAKLIFPPRVGTSWNGNKYNSNEEDEYTVTEIVNASTIKGLTFDETATVLQENNDDLIVFYDYREEKYARGVGLVSKIVNQLEFCTQDACLGQQIVTNGIEYKQEIVAYGRN
jgi:hypothetical protein